MHSELVASLPTVHSVHCSVHSVHGELVAGLPTVEAVQPGKTILTVSGFPHSDRVTWGYEAKGQILRACLKHQMVIAKYLKSAN